MTKKRGQNIRRIIIRDEKHGLPYSKGLMASSIMATGLPPSRAYEVAKQIETRLLAARKYSVGIPELRRVTLDILRSTVGEEYAAKFQKWQALSKLDKPMVILIGGTTGVGKSTIATEMAHRLGITRIISTDAIREVMRSIFSRELMPALYDSSFNAWRTLRVPLPASADPIIIGFREQASAVAVGVRALIERAITEGAHQIVEGVHLVPGFIDFSAFNNDAFIISILITVDDEDLHRSHFYIREIETEGFRPFERYRANFDNIRKIGNYIETLAKDNGIPIISSHNLDLTVSVVLEEVISRVISSEAETAPPAGPVKAKIKAGPATVRAGRARNQPVKQ